MSDIPTLAIVYAYTVVIFFVVTGGLAFGLRRQRRRIRELNARLERIEAYLVL